MLSFRALQQCWGAWLLVQTPLLQALDRFVTLDVKSSARQIVVLEGSTRANDDVDTFAEPTTWVPSCKWYRKIPCTCSHVQHAAEDGRFIPGWDRMWHLPSLLRNLGVQQLFRRESTALTYVGPYFWHASGIGNFKNSLDVFFFVGGQFAGFFAGNCKIHPECQVSAAFLKALNWLITMKQFALFPVESQIKDSRLFGYGDEHG